MSFDPTKMCKFAQLLLEDNKVCDGEDRQINTIKLATVVNRTYYSVYLRLVDILKKEYNEHPKLPGDHRRARRSLRNTMDRGDLYDMYRTLENDRVNVDYKLKNNINQGKNFERLATSSIDTAKELLRELDIYEPKY